MIQKPCIATLHRLSVEQQPRRELCHGAGLAWSARRAAGQPRLAILQHQDRCQGLRRTDRFKKGAEEAKGGADDYVRMKVGGIPVGRLGEAHEIASAVCFLVSAQASYINGVALQVDGGVIKAI